MPQPGPFDFICDDAEATSAEQRQARLRPLASRVLRHLERGAEFYEPTTALRDAVNAALALEKPLLLTGEPGVGKTQAASFIASYFGLPTVHKLEVRSTSTAQDLLYTFDAVRYYRDAQLARGAVDRGADAPSLHRSDYVIPGPLWEAIREEPVGVLLVDEIDKAPRDFPNDLLDALDQFRFPVPELKYADRAHVEGSSRLRGAQLIEGRDDWEVVRTDARRAPIVVITSNAETRLPEPFLRRCIFHEIRFDEAHLRRVIERRRARFEATQDLIEPTIRRVLELRALDRPRLKKKPSTAEVLEWLYLLAQDPPALARLDAELGDLPYLEVLLKTREDLARVRAPKTGRPR